MLVRFMATLLLVAAGDNGLRADGGAVRCSAREGRLRITVFTSPTPPRVGLVDVSVLIQDATSGEPYLDARVGVRATSRDHPNRVVAEEATRDAATNGWLVAAVLDLPSEGAWDLEVIVDRGEDRARVPFELEVGPPAPGLLSLALWIAWPILAAAVYAIHQARIRTRNEEPGTWNGPPVEA